MKQIQAGRNGFLFCFGFLSQWPGQRSDLLPDLCAEVVLQRVREDAVTVTGRRENKIITDGLLELLTLL